VKHASIYRISASLICVAAGLGQNAKTPVPTVVSVVDGDISRIEKRM
jgi:hypothetical protein